MDVYSTRWRARAFVAVEPRERPGGRRPREPADAVDELHELLPHLAGGASGSASAEGWGARLATFAKKLEERWQVRARNVDWPRVCVDFRFFMFRVWGVEVADKITEKNSQCKNAHTCFSFERLNNFKHSLSPRCPDVDSQLCTIGFSKISF